MEEKLKLVTAGLTLLSVVLGIIKIFIDKSKKQESVSVGRDNKGIINNGGIVVGGDNNGSITQNSGNTYNNSYQVIHKHYLASDRANDSSENSWVIICLTAIAILFVGSLFRYIEPYLYLVSLFIPIRILIWTFTGKAFLPYENLFLNILFLLSPAIVILETWFLFNSDLIRKLIEQVEQISMSNHILDNFKLFISSSMPQDEKLSYGVLAIIVIIIFSITILSQVSSFLIPFLKKGKLFNLLETFTYQGFLWVAFSLPIVAWGIFFLIEYSKNKVSF